MRKKNKVIRPVFAGIRQCINALIHNSHRRSVEEQDTFPLQQNILLRRNKERKSERNRNITVVPLLIFRKVKTNNDLPKQYAGSTQI